MGRNIHEKPFDEGTLIKLDIFEEYTKVWLPTFIMSDWPNIYIFDFFAGPGRSLTGQEGSPLRILRQIESQAGNIFQRQKHIHVRFNEYDENKFAKLKDNIEKYKEEHSTIQRLQEQRLLKISEGCESFENLFPKYKSTLGSAPALMFFDQNGIKFLDDQYLLPLLQSKSTDFMFFASSSYFSRFSEQKAFANHVKISKEAIDKNPYKYIHRVLLDSLRAKIPHNSSMRLFPFSIKKGKNIYGIIFGSSHILGADKFLRVAWNINSTNGEANFDIDDDKDKGQPDLFGYVQLKKTQIFQQDLRKFVLSKVLKTNKDVYDFTINHGFISCHADEELRKMKKGKLIKYSSKTPLVNYEKVYKNQRIITFDVL